MSPLSCRAWYGRALGPTHQAHCGMQDVDSFAKFVGLTPGTPFKQHLSMLGAREALPSGISIQHSMSFSALCLV